jgi:hypothetical protein
VQRAQQVDGHGACGQLAFFGGDVLAEITGLTLTNVATKLSRIKDKLKKMNKEE